MVLKTEHLALSLPGKSKPLFRDISLDLDAGEMCIVSGKAGSGKTLLGLALCGFLPLWMHNWRLDGRIELCGRPLNQGEYRDEAGIILENPYNQVSGIKRSVIEELAFPLECRGVQPSLMHDLIDRYADTLGISRLLKRNVRFLSGGELQRVIIACSLISCPRFLFLDRLMTEIDADFRAPLLNIIASHIKEHDGSALIAEDYWLLPNYRFQRKIHLGPDDSPEIMYPLPIYETAAASKRDNTSDMLSLESVSFAYGEEEPVLDNVSFSLGSGEVMFLTGQNGAGKTTLARLIAGIDNPVSGEIIIDGRSFGEMEQWEKMSLAGFALQNPGLHLSRKTVREELALPSRFEKAQ
ncbi:MAG: ATP-binding cassette domain-containing protein, partial [Candidatus Latescibacteria bacterium]|nr:ATP-binding cassette domain-containing protein [Candidatus Latescibacterota bacterium]